MKNLEHPWNLSNAEKILYSEKSSLDFKMFFKMVLLGTVHWKVICVEVSSHEIKIIYSSLCLLLIQYKPVWVTWVNTIFFI